LKSVVTVDASFWTKSPSLYTLLAGALRAVPDFPEEVARLVQTFLRGCGSLRLP
jgi:hypothetical protein